MNVCIDILSNCNKTVCVKNNEMSGLQEVNGIKKQLIIFGQTFKN